MNTAQTATQQPIRRFQDLIEAGAAALPGRGRGWLDTQRAFAVKQFLQRGLPARSEEAWRYTSLDRLLDQPWSLRTGGDTSAGIDRATLRLADRAAARLVFVDGRFSAALSELPTADTALRTGSLHTALQERPNELADWLGQAILPAPGLDESPGKPCALSTFAALNTALLDDGAWVHVPAGVRLDAPVELVYVCTAQTDAAVMQPRNLIVLEDGAAATVVEHYLGHTGNAYFTNAVTEALIGRDAQLEHARLQDEGPAARHLGNVYLRQRRNSRYRGLSVSLGALWSRCEYHNCLHAEQAQSELDGLYLAGSGQLTDVHLNIDHGVPNCSSRERFKGILLGKGRAVFDGRVRVQVGAQKTDAHLANDNLLLSRDAEVDTKPQLEIYADDVKCSHGTTIGQLEPAQLFYLRARGIDTATARRLLCLGFATEILAGCSVEGFGTRVEQRIEQLLANAPAGETGGEHHV